MSFHHCCSAAVFVAAQNRPIGSRIQDTAINLPTTSFCSMALPPSASPAPLNLPYPYHPLPSSRLSAAMLILSAPPPLPPCPSAAWPRRPHPSPQRSAAAWGGQLLQAVRAHQLHAAGASPSASCSRCCCSCCLGCQLPLVGWAHHRRRQQRQQKRQSTTATTTATNINVINAISILTSASQYYRHLFPTTTTATTTTTIIINVNIMSILTSVIQYAHHH